MRHLADLVLRHRILIIAAWAAIAIAGGLATLTIDERLAEDFAQPGQAAYEANQEIVRIYGNGGDDPPMVAVIRFPSGARAARDAIDSAFDAAEERLGARVASYGNTGDSRFIGDDGRTTYGLIITKPTRGLNADLSEPAERAMLPHLPPRTELRITGLEQLADVQYTGGLSLLAEVIIGGAGALLVLAWIFRSILALLPLLVGLIGIVVSFLILTGVTYITRVSVIAEYVVALVGLGLAIDYSLLLVTRWREERAAGAAGDEAVRRAMVTAGHSVVVSGGAVAIGMAAMAVIPVPFLRSIAFPGIAIPLVSVAAAVTLVPVVLSAAGARLDWPRRRLPAPRHRAWTAWIRSVVRLRVPVTLAAVAVLLGLAAIGTNLHLGSPPSAGLSGTGASGEGLAMLRDSGSPSGVLTPVDVLVAPGGDPSRIATGLARLPGVHTAIAPDEYGWRRDGTAMVSVIPVHEGGTPEGEETLARIERSVPAEARVGGELAQTTGFVRAVYGVFPLMLLLISLATVVVLVRAFGSLVLAVKAVLLNLLALGAIMGAMVIIWQYGYGAGLIWGLSPMGAIEAFVPALIFAFLYGLSMDYEVFILSRIREEYDRTGSTGDALITGLSRSGRLVTSAALILFLAFSSLAAAPQPQIKVFATGLGLGILIDATLVRMVLVPGIIALLGDRTWWLPGWLRRPTR